MGGVYRVITKIYVNKDAEILKVWFCHNWTGDDWFIRLQFRGKETDRIYFHGNYAKYTIFERIVRKFVKEFVIEEKRATFKKINEIVKEIAGKKPIWFKTYDKEIVEWGKDGKRKK